MRSPRTHVRSVVDPAFRQLVARLVVWAQACDRQLDTQVLGRLVSAKAEGGSLTRWSVADVQALLHRPTGHDGDVVSHAATSGDTAAGDVPTLLTLVEFLSASNALHPGSDSLADLRAAATGACRAPLCLDTVAAVLRSHGPTASVQLVQRLGEVDEQAEAIERLTAEASPGEWVGVLEAIADHHPHETVARSARRALFRQRSRLLG